ncbi:DMT family transporter [Desulfosporosinus nitroreducens]|uniref:Multidrug resistance efflux transporter family protein n=1 Tax=Desulfosporosinus nitroreducens TaxID=2018668 RepID=A0ABT8QN29_9FIRM|nr:multidrug resistance efflux transporter family protein [Desulfosporosinus nitroreducens]MDO0822743.1 multidrug resistance efflux transporter family protein [Desulfosporosinus nitroreducens]
MLGILASFFFAVTFVLNRTMDLSGGSWIWSAVLRYAFMLPPLLVLVLARRNLKPLLIDMRQRPLIWLVWSTIGFGIFYAPLCLAADYGPAWLVASMWQITIVAGSLLVPFFYTAIQTETGLKKVRSSIPVKGLAISLIILLGIGLMQLQQAQVLTAKEIIFGILPVLVAAFAYPLGNRKMMDECAGRFDPYQRVLGMTLASLPFWLVLSVIGVVKVGLPSGNQTVQSVIVALSSGVIATILFFSATDMTKGNVHKLAAVEATQSGEVIFALLGELLILHGPFPTMWSIAGMLLIVLGMILHSFLGQGEKS